MSKYITHHKKKGRPGCCSVELVGKPCFCRIQTLKSTLGHHSQGQKKIRILLRLRSDFFLRLLAPSSTTLSRDSSGDQRRCERLAGGGPRAGPDGDHVRRRSPVDLLGRAERRRTSGDARAGAEAK